MTNIEKIVVTFEVAGNNEYQKTKNINEFLRNSFREFAASYNVIDYEVLSNELLRVRRRNDHALERECI